jgi:predicted RNA-binding protein with EMAP domain
MIIGRFSEFVGAAAFLPPKDFLVICKRSFFLGRQE